MIKNYTSSVAASKSVAHIEDQLVSHGAYNILKIYDDKKLDGIAFIIKIEGKEIPFQLPSNIKEVEKIFFNRHKNSCQSVLSRVPAQAERTAWKIISDWVDIQMAMVELKQVEFAAVFMHCIYDHSKKETFYQKFKKNNFLMLEKK